MQTILSLVGDKSPAAAVATSTYGSRGRLPMISVVEVDDYIYLVPFVETEAEIFLKTIIPSRKATRQFRSKP